MARKKQTGGGGRFATDAESTALRRTLGLDAPPAVDLNSADADLLKNHPLINRKLAAKIVDFRKKQPIRSLVDLYQAGLVTEKDLRALENSAFGEMAVRPFVTRIQSDDEAFYVDEPFSVDIHFSRQALTRPELVSVEARFPSGMTGQAHYRLSDEDRQRGQLTVGEFVSTESGEFHLFVTLRDAAGQLHKQTATFNVFTRNPVRMYITPSYWTQSGSVGAPKFDFGQRRWYCYASVRWVNSTDRTVNLGRRVTVRVTDAGNQIDTFSFDLSGDVVIPARTTIYGNLHTWHGEGGSIFNIFHAKGDLTYQYSMSGSGFTPTISQIWRTMRVIGYNIIRVGDFTNAERNEYRRAAAEVASGIFQSRDMTVYGVELKRIEGTREMDADKTRFRFIDNEDEGKAMMNRYTVSDNWYLDIFFVEGIWDGSFGYTYANGPVDKQGDLSGIVIRRDSDTVNLGQTFAHEAGHYLGLQHADADDGCSDTNPSDPNISDNFIFSSSRRDSDVITLCQIDKMRRHGLVRSMTP